MPVHAVYMFQQVEYRAIPFVQWMLRLPNMSKIMHRQKLVGTKAAKLLIIGLYSMWFLTVVAGVGLMVWDKYTIIAAILLIASPVLAITAIVLLMSIARSLIVSPKERRLQSTSQKILSKHPAKIIAVAGSYGKTTMKELLATVLSEKYDVAATKGNMNTLVGHARFSAGLSGKEDVLVMEYGEGKPGDVARFAQNSQPDYAIITGLAPNHLDAYKTIANLAKDILSLRQYVSNENILITGESDLLQKYIEPTDHLFSSKRVDGWFITNIKINFKGTTFDMNKADSDMHIASKLLGRHQVAPLAAAASLAIKLGLTERQVESGLARTEPFEHRMSPYIVSGAQIVDDTYNGNLEGSLAGIALLRELSAKRRIYVTPGLVEQGSQKHFVHQKIAKALISAKPDIVVLMKNSSTAIIEDYLNNNKFNGELKIETNPLGFYQNIEHFVAKGDLVVMQNDWTDNYS